MTVLFRACHDRPAATDLERWRESVDRTFGPVRLRSPADAAAHLPERLVVGDVGAVRVSEMTICWDSPSGSCHAARTPRLIRQADLDPEQYRIDVAGRGRMLVEQDGRQAPLGSGDFAVVDLARPARWTVAAEQAIYLMVPKALLPLRPDEVAGLGGVRFGGDRGAAALLASLASEAVAHLDDYGPAEGARVGTALVDLLTAALAARLDRRDDLPPDSRRRALLAGIHAFIEQRLGDPGLSPGVVAAAHHLSVRSLHKLFETQPTSAAGWIRRRRLERCRRDLLDPALRILPVSAIGARWGLPSPAHFNRAFRAAYGVTPGEYRTTMGAAAGTP
jgi:AraC-like DNA-binding protein